MCWAVPTRLIEIDGDVGKVEIGGTVREVGLQLVKAPQVGDYVLIHAGFAIQKVDEAEALQTLELLTEMATMMHHEGVGSRPGAAEDHEETPGS